MSDENFVAGELVVYVGPLTGDPDPSVLLVIGPSRRWPESTVAAVVIARWPGSVYGGLSSCDRIFPSVACLRRLVDLC